MQDPNVLLTILGKMAQKPRVKFDKLYQKLYNVELWLMAYERIAPKPGNMIPFQKRDGTIKEYVLMTSTKQMRRGKVIYGDVDLKPNTWMYRGQTELGQRLRAHQCEWCGTQEGPIEVHHIRKLKDLKGKEAWKRQMIARRRKTMVLCEECHDELHAGKLSEAKRRRENWRAGHLETCTSGSGGRAVRPGIATY